MKQVIILTMCCVVKATYLHVPVKGDGEGRKGGVPGSIGVDGDGGVKVIGGSTGVEGGEVQYPPLDGGFDGVEGVEGVVGVEGSCGGDDTQPTEGGVGV